MRYLWAKFNNNFILVNPILPLVAARENGLNESLLNEENLIMLSLPSLFYFFFNYNENPPQNLKLKKRPKKFSKFSKII